MKKLILALLLILSFSANAQIKVDTIIDTKVYKSYFCKAIKEPLYVSYILYKGGGDCDRSGFRFKNDTKLKTATQKDYAASGYDQGHLAGAEDFAYDCPSDEKTFRFYNCLPQTPNLNRGVWKKWETEIRKESQIDSLYIVCGGQFDVKQTIGNGVWVPTHCWKVVQSVKTKKIKHVLYFDNTNKATYKEITIAELEKILGYKIPLIK
jgi:endonuclease G